MKKYAFAVIARPVKHKRNKKGLAVSFYLGNPEFVYDELGEGDCCCSNPEEAFYIFKDRHQAESKARWLSPSRWDKDSARVVRVGFPFKSIKVLPFLKD